MTAWMPGGSIAKVRFVRIDLSGLAPAIYSALIQRRALARSQIKNAIRAQPPSRRTVACESVAPVGVNIVDLDEIPRTERVWRTG
jgi:hypothetical protein